MEAEYSSWNDVEESRVHWSELEESSQYWSRLEETSSSSEVEDADELRKLAADNLKFFHSLQEQWPGGFFQVMGDEWEVGRNFGVGG